MYNFLGLFFIHSTEWYVYIFEFINFNFSPFIITHIVFIFIQI
jgi:hypothetical protein